VKGTLAFLGKHSELAKKAIAVGSRERGAKAPPAGEALLELQELLVQYLSGLEELEDFDHPAHITSADFEYPPFEFWIPIDNWVNKRRNLAQAGLIFHLTYLFRYFTSPTLPEHIDARFIDWRFEFYGPMLTGFGKAHAKLVAPLVNAVFQTKYSPVQVRNWLKELTIRRKSKGSNLRNPVRFSGWALVDREPTK
jgi:hypothetical protein